MSVLQNEHKKIQYMIDSLVLPFLKNQHPKWRELIRVYLEFLDEHPLSKALNITDNVDANTMYSYLLDEFLNLYFKDVVDINKFGLNDDNKRLFISLSKLIGNLKATKTSYGFFFNSFTDFSIPTDSGDINVDDMTVTLEEKPEWWLTNNDTTRPFTYIFKIDNTNLSNLKELIKEVHPAGWIQLFLMEVVFEEFMTGYDCFELDIHYGAYHNGKWNHDGVMTVEGGEVVTLYHDGGHTRSDPINCAPKPRWFNSTAAIQSSITSALAPGQLEISQQPVGGQFIAVPGDDTFIFTVDSSPNPISWQWYNTSGAMPGEITNTLTITSATEADTDTYYCEISNGGPPIESDHVYLVVTVCPIAFNDDFNGSDDDPPDSNRWTYYQASIQDNQLYLDVDPGSLAWAKTKYNLHEDFSVTVDFELDTPVASQDAWNVILECWVDSNDYCYVALFGGDTPTQIYSVIYSTTNKRTIFSPWGPEYTTGKLRLVRRGYTIECWTYNIDDLWNMTTSWTGGSSYQITTDSVPIKLRAQTFSPWNPIQNVSFDNLIVEGSCAVEPYLGEFESQSNIVYSIPDAELFSPIYTDSFEGADGTQPTNWDVVISANSSEIYQNSVRFISSGGETPTYKVNNFVLNGDFDIAWNYGWNTLNDSTWQSYIRVGGATPGHGFVMHISVENYDWLSVDPPVVYHTRSDSNNGGNDWETATGQVGKMRIKRISGLQYSYFWDAGTNGWIKHKRTPMTMSNGAFTPYFSFHSDTITANVDAWLYNFQVYSAEDLEYI